MRDCDVSILMMPKMVNYQCIRKWLGQGPVRRYIIALLI
uniref:Uncharacterized protein n=1 Tax=Anguilla anguilla TaxID=7936 RepID=A0A0E9V0C1_ANGAN